jgi:hypothetical protein
VHAIKYKNKHVYLYRTTNDKRAMRNKKNCILFAMAISARVVAILAIAFIGVVAMGGFAVMSATSKNEIKKMKTSYEAQIANLQGSGNAGSSGNGGNPNNGNNGNNGSNGNSGSGGSPCCGCVNTDQRSLVNNVINQTEGGGSIPSDSIIAVGNDDDGGRYIVIVNRAGKIYNKRTNAAISQFSHDSCFLCNYPTADAYVTWDPTSERFFMTLFESVAVSVGLDVLTPASLAGLRNTGQFGVGSTSIPTTFSITGNVLDTVPFNGCSPFTGPSVAGKIALISRGTCNFSLKAWNAQQAGAIGVIIYNSVAGGDSIINMLCADSFCMNITIPTYSVYRSVGLAMLSAIPTVNVRMFGPFDTQHSTIVDIAVSTTSAPNDALTDFYHYKIPTDQLYPNSLGDYLKHATNFDTLFLSTQDFGTQYANGTWPYIGARITAIDKTALLNGTAVFINSTSTSILYTHVFPKMSFVMPAENRMKLMNPNQPTYFIGPVGADQFTTGVNVLWATHQGFHSLTPTVLTTPPMYVGDFGPGGRQPPPAVPSDLEMAFLVSTAVVRQQGARTYLYSAFGYNVSTVHSAIRWWKIEVTNAWSNGQLSMSQQGDYNPGLDLDVSYPHLDVDKDGNMGLSGVISGPKQYASLFYTSRLVNDPPNTLRYPPIIWQAGNSTYFSDFGTGRNRWQDYSGCQVDPSDGKTFYMIGQFPSPTGVFVNGVNTEWTTSVGTMQVNANGSCDVQSPTTPGPSQCTGSQETSYAKQNPRVFSTAAIAHTVGSIEDDVVDLPAVAA